MTHERVVSTSTGLPDLSIIHAIVKTMIGEFLFKNARRMNGEEEETGILGAAIYAFMV